MDAPPPSAIQKLLTPHPPPPHPAHLHHLALQIQHNLSHQHLWTALTLHTLSPLSGHPLPRPLLSGLPPRRLYIHPDEQLAQLHTQPRPSPPQQSTREWVLPSALRERWSLARFGAVFDALPANEQAHGEEWRATKRVLLATLDDDSTVVYYIVHDGVVKPRQN